MNNIIVKGHIDVFPEDRCRLKKKKKPFEEQTIVINISNDIGRLYRTFLLKEEGILLEPPPFGCHVTLNNGKTSFNVKQHKQYLKELQGKTITLSLSVDMYQHWEFFLLSADGHQLNKIRTDLGLPVKTDFHATIGRIHPLAKKPSVLSKFIYY